MNTRKTAPDILRGAATRIRRRGWTTGRLQDESGNMCAIGAMRYSAFGSSYVMFRRFHPNFKAYKAAAKELRRVMLWHFDVEDRRRNHVMFMNDSMIRGGHQLAEYMDEAADHHLAHPR